MLRYLLVLSLILLFAGRVSSQNLGPETPVLGKTIFGINGLAILEVALPSEISYNPAAVELALQLFKEEQYVEADFGILDFHAGPQVKNDWQVYLFRLPKGSLRLAKYGITSSVSEIVYLGPGPKVKFQGQTIEMSYGRQVSPKLFLGLVIIPSKEIKTDVFFEVENLAETKAKSSLHGRLGALYLINSKTSVGIVYTYDKMAAKTRLLPVLTGEPTPIDIRANYRERLLTVGVGWQPVEGTALYLTWQKGKVSGPNVSEEIDLKAFGIQQFLNPNLCLQVGLNDKVLCYSLTYYGQKWNLGASYSKSTYRRTEEFFGRADIWYIWLGKNW